MLETILSESWKYIYDFILTPGIQQGVRIGISYSNSLHRINESRWLNYNQRETETETEMNIRLNIYEISILASCYA